MGLFNKIINRVVSDGFEANAEKESPAVDTPAADYHHTGTTMINTKELFKDGFCFRRGDNIYKDVEDENDKGRWWNYEGNPDADLNRFEIPYDPETLTEAIKHLNNKIESGDIPIFTLPVHIVKVMQLLTRDDFDYAEVASLIEKSPALAGMFISSINSSFYNRGFAITELRPALSRLGKNNIRALLQLYSIKIGFAEDRRFGKIAENIINHSYIVAVIASYLSQRFFPDPGLAFLAGLLHDIGKLGILKELSQTPRFCLKLKSDISEQMFGRIFDKRHELVGRKLGEKWNMDPLSLAAIEAHHNFWEFPFSDEDQLDYHLCLIVNLSDTIARILGKGKPIGKVNIFKEPATIDLNMEKNPSTLGFLEEIPEIVNFKAANQIF